MPARYCQIAPDAADESGPARRVRSRPAKQKRRIVMKKKTLLFAALLLLIGSAVIPAHGQAGGVKVKVNVPFNFVLGDKTYPAGEYAFSAVRDNVIVQNSAGTRIAMRMANHVAGRSAGKNGQVIFDCYVNQCFLSQIWTPGQDDGRQLLRSRMETRAAATQVGQYMALLGTSAQQ
jgi:hypothetical protein